MCIPSSSSNLKIVIRECAAALKALLCCTLYAVCIADQIRLHAKNPQRSHDTTILSRLNSLFTCDKRKTFRLTQTSERAWCGFRGILHVDRDGMFTTTYIPTLLQMFSLHETLPCHLLVAESITNIQRPRSLGAPPPTRTTYSAYKLTL